jgi:hypothetical protein
MNERTVVVVRVPGPWWAPKALIRRKFEQVLPEYAAAEGLEHKAFTFIDGCFGGVYQWSSRARAETWFDQRWHARVKRQRGVDGDVRFFDVLAQRSTGALQGRSLPFDAVRVDAVITQVTFAKAEAGHAHALAEWAQGSVRSTVAMGRDGLSVFSLWNEPAHARAFLLGDALARATRLVGVTPQVHQFEAPVVLDNAARQARDAGASVAA